MRPRKGLPPVVSILIACLLAACGNGQPNTPYPAAESAQKIVYDFFNERPKHLDPVQAYVENEADILYQIYEPLYDYDFLKRPYALKPQLATAMPKIHYYDARGRQLSDKAPVERIARTVYEIHLREGVRFQPHPAFAQDASGHYLYHALTPADIAGKYAPSDFAQSGTRELRSEDFAYQIKRLARPGLQSPIFETLKLIDGLEELQTQLAADAKQGKIDPAGWIDMRAYPLRGVETPDAHTLRITLHGKYPQFIYWLAQTFVVPMPWEADRFFSQSGMAHNNLTLDVWPVGTGPFMQSVHDPNLEIRLVRNPNWRGEPYPCEGTEEDRKAGLLDDCGKTMPLIDGISLRMEKEGIPFWNKLQQGYYDVFRSKVMALANFDSAIQMQAGGGLDLTDEMRKKGFRLQTEVEPGIWDYQFNMLDPVVGGGNDAASKERARKLRQAIAITLDIDEFLSVFFNGLGVSAQGPIPPALPGYKEGCAGRNPYVFDCVKNKVQRKSLDDAKKLLAEAGYPDGRDAKTGEPLILYFDYVDKPDARVKWIIEQFRRVGIQLVPRLTDFNRFQDKARTGTYQILFWGWGADYPDPENFLFLFYGKNAKVKYGGENVANYSNPEFDKLYEQLKSTDINAPSRPQLIDRMVEILRHDAPWVFGWHDETFQLQHGWLHNSKPGRIIHSIRKYQSLDLDLRNARRAEWNRPVLWPIIPFILLIAAAFWYVRHQYRQKEQRRAVTGVRT